MVAAAAAPARLLRSAGRLALVAAALLACPAVADDRPWGLFEIKRQNTARGTPEESTRTTLRFERYLDGPVAQLRLDLPFPDAKDTFGGSPFDPRPGDLKLRARFRSLPADRGALGSFVEFTFPTANPESLGGGKYQVGPAVDLPIPLDRDAAGRPSGNRALRIEVQQVWSVAGDPAQKDINYTKFTVDLRQRWGEDWTGKLTFKPVVDWVQNGKTGAVLELEAGYRFDREWRVVLMIGWGLWG
jgi:hypothetical protein